MRFPFYLNNLHLKILFTGNASLSYLAAEELHNCLLCEQHFVVEDFINPVLKNRLKSCAIPIPYTTISEPSTSTLETSIPSKDYSWGCNNETINNLCLAEEGSTSGSEDWVKKLIELPCTPTEKRSLTDAELNKQIINKQKRIITNLKVKLETKTKRLALQRTQICHLKTVLKKMKNMCKTEFSIISYNFLMKWSKTLVSMQLKKKRELGKKMKKSLP